MEKNQRALRIKAFLEKDCGLAGYRLEDMVTDASVRRYFRVVRADGSTAVLMDDESPYTKIREFVKIDSLLRGIGVRAPEILAQKTEEGFLLLEDFGDRDFAAVLDGRNDAAVFKLAVDALLKIYKNARRPDYVKDMDDAFIVKDFRLFLDWYMPAVLGKGLSDRQRREFLDIIGGLLPLGAKVPSSLVLWDYHVNNVMLPPNSNECGVIDFQDAMWGPSLYDLASLIEDERRVIAPEVTAEMKEYFFANISGVVRDDFEDAYAFLALLRHMRVIGRFTTLITVSKKPWYAKYVPHALELLKRTLEYPKFAILKRWLDENLPEARRTVPESKPISKAFVLAAGRGVRMGELTDSLPKPLIEVNGKALIDYNFDKLKDVGIKDVTVNVCYKGKMIEEHLAGRTDFNIAFSEEKEALETGGGIKNALHLMGNEAFFVMNSDTLWVDRGFKPAMRQMLDEWDGEKYDILLLLHPMEQIFGDNGRGIGNYRLDGQGRPQRNVNKEKGFPYWFTGVSIVHPRVFADSPDGKFSLRDLFDKAEKNGRLGFVVNEGILFHVGVPEAVRETEKKLLAIAC